MKYTGKNSVTNSEKRNIINIGSMIQTYITEVIL